MSFLLVSNPRVIFAEITKWACYTLNLKEANMSTKSVQYSPFSIVQVFRRIYANQEHMLLFILKTPPVSSLPHYPSNI